MTGNQRLLLATFLMLNTAGWMAAQSGPRVPRGIYAEMDLHNTDMMAQNAAGVALQCPAANRAAVDAIMVNYFLTFLNNSAIAGLAVEIPWNELKCAIPGPTAASVTPMVTSSGDYQWSYKNAPMNMVEIYDVDVLYALGLSMCQMVQYTENPVEGIPPDLGACVGLMPVGGFGSVALTEAEFDFLALSLALTGEGPLE